MNQEIHVTFKPNFKTAKAFAKENVKPKIWAMTPYCADQWIETFSVGVHKAEVFIKLAMDDPDVIRVKHEIDIHELKDQKILYYEAHVNIYVYPYMFDFGLLDSFESWGISTNLLGNFHKICLTTRTKTKDELYERAKSLKDFLLEKSITHDSFELEGCVFDTNRELDKGWIE